MGDTNYTDFISDILKSFVGLIMVGHVKTAILVSDVWLVLVAMCWVAIVCVATPRCPVGWQGSSCCNCYPDCNWVVWEGLMLVMMVVLRC